LHSSQSMFSAHHTHSTTYILSLHDALPILSSSSIKQVEQSSITPMNPTLRGCVRNVKERFPTDFLRRPIIAALMSSCGILVRFFALIGVAENWVRLLLMFPENTTCTMPLG